MENLIINVNLIPILAPVIIALNVVVGKYVDTKWLPLSSIGLGVVACLVLGGLTVSSGITGLIVGLVACGVYDTKSIVLPKK